MENKEIASNCLKTLITIASAIIVFFWLIHPKLVAESFAEVGPEGIKQIEQQREVNDKEDNFYLEDGLDGNMLLHNNYCSKSCCSEQYPTSFKLQYDKKICNSKDEYVPTNLMCNSGDHGTGCLCMKKEQAEFLASRGGNNAAK